MRERQRDTVAISGTFILVPAKMSNLRLAGSRMNSPICNYSYIYLLYIASHLYIHLRKMLLDVMSEDDIIRPIKESISSECGRDRYSIVPVPCFQAAPTQIAPPTPCSNTGSAFAQPRKAAPLLLQSWRQGLGSFSCIPPEVLPRFGFLPADPADSTHKAPGALLSNRATTAGSQADLCGWLGSARDGCRHFPKSRPWTVFSCLLSA